MSKHPAVEALRNFQTQLDPDGQEVSVSRRAVDETITYIEELEAGNTRLREGVKRLKDSVGMYWSEDDPEFVNNFRKDAHRANNPANRNKTKFRFDADDFEKPRYEYTQI